MIQQEECGLETHQRAFLKFLCSILARQNILILIFHLIVGDSGRKLFEIEKFGNGPDLQIRLVTEGEWRDKSPISKNGFTVWSLKNGKVRPTPCKDKFEQFVYA